MSSDRPSDDPSRAPDAEIIRAHGEPLLDALEARLPGSRSHAESVATWALAIAVELGLGRERSLAVQEMARLHQIGKVYLASELIDRPLTELSQEDARRLDAYGAIGSSLAEGAGVPPEACGWLRYTRERYDGRGEPEGLFGGAIPLEARIIRVASSFQAALERAGDSREWSGAPMVLAITEVRAAGGTELDRGAVEALASAVSQART